MCRLQEIQPGMDAVSPQLSIKVIPIMTMFSGLFCNNQRSRGRRRNLSVYSAAACEVLENRELLAADPVIDWNNAALDAIRISKTAPPVAARALAIIQTAVFDSVNSIDRQFAPFMASVNADPRASQAAAVAAAAHDTLVALFPAQKATFDAKYAASLSLIPDGRPETDGVNVGQAITGMILAARADDGSTKSVTYLPDTRPRHWNPTPPGFQSPLLPQWPQVRPWIMINNAQFRPAAPPRINSSAYAADLNMVKQLGSANSTTRTADQTSVAYFWAGGPGTATPPGEWNVIAQIVATQNNNTLAQNARLFAMLDTTLADAAIVSWESKYFYDLWRPVTAIRLANTDNNPATVVDLNWTSLLVTPSFPTYTSGHSTFSGAAAAVLKGFFGTDQMSFVAPSEVAGVPSRSFTSFSQAAAEAGISRIYGGIHFNFDNVAGLTSGKQLGAYAVRNFMKNSYESASANVSNGELLIAGTSKADRIAIRLTNNNYYITSNGRQLGQFLASNVNTIIINAGAGQNIVRTTRVTVPVQVYGALVQPLTNATKTDSPIIAASRIGNTATLKALDNLFAGQLL